jgi:hypothetical protein
MNRTRRARDWRALPFLRAEALVHQPIQNQFAFHDQFFYPAAVIGELNHTTTTTI